jgi:hypothetical protein
MTYPFSDDYTFAIMNDQNVSVELANFQNLLNLPPQTFNVMEWSHHPCPLCWGVLPGSP